MPSQVTSGTVIFRQWDPSHGLRETVQRFDSLDDLFELCLHVEDPRLVDRIIIEGYDAAGNPRVLTFRFQSMTVSDHVPSAHE